METYIKLSDVDYDGLGHNFECVISVSGGDRPIQNMIEMVKKVVKQFKLDEQYYETGKIVDLVVSTFEEYGFTVKDCTPSVTIDF